jgi:GntR family transcriptional repressor for pyruvate dehydrogenase complex
MPRTLPFKPLQKRRLYEEVAEQIKQSILRGKLKPGDRLPSERELCQIFGVGRPTVREALRTLGMMGLIEVRTGTKGSVVKEGDIGEYMGSLREQLSWLIQVDRGTLRDLWEVRRHIEQGIAHAVARNATEDDLGKLESLLKKMEAASSDMKAYFRVAREFHSELAQATGNRIFSLVWELFDDILLRGYVPNLDEIFPQGPSGLLEGNRVLLEAIKSRQPQRIAKAAQFHTEAEDLFTTVSQGSGPNQTKTRTRSRG